MGNVVRPMFNAKQRTLDHYIIAVELMGLPHRVYRVLSVPSDIYLNYLEEMIVLAMGWAGHHQMQIVAGGLTYCSREDMEMCSERGRFSMRDAALFTLRDVMSKKDDQFVFVYDLGDHWEHRVLLIKKEKYEAGYADDSRVDVVGGEGCCPPDDCGGAGGYAELLKVLRMGSTEEREELEEWLSIWGIEDYDVQEFSLRDAKNRVCDFQRVLESVRMGVYRGE